MESNEKLENDNQLKMLNEKVSKQEQIIENLNSEIEEKNIIISRTKAYLFDLEYNLDNKNKKIDDEKAELTRKYNAQISKLQSKDYCIFCLKEEIEDKNHEIEYHKKNKIIKKILSPLSYLYLIFKSKPRELKLNFKLLKALKNSKCFDVGYYLNNNYVKNAFACKYLSPELHYIVKGFDKKYIFNKKFFKRNSKQELLKYINYCNKY